MVFYEGKSVPQDFAEAMKWFHKAAAKDHANAQSNIGYMYQHGEGVPQDFAEAMKWYLKAAEKDHAIAQFYIGAMYNLGKGVPQDLAEALKWYREAGKKDNAQCRITIVSTRCDEHQVFLRTKRRGAMYNCSFNVNIYCL